MGRIEPYQGIKYFGGRQIIQPWKLPQRPFRDLPLIESTLTQVDFLASINAVKCALVEIKPKNIVFGTDYPRRSEMRPK